MENICDDSGFSTMFDIGDFDMDEGVSVGINKVGGNLGSSSIISGNNIYEDDDDIGMKSFGVENAFDGMEIEYEDLPKLEALPVKIVEENLQFEKIPIAGGEEEDNIPVKIVDLNNNYDDALLVHKKDIIYNGSGYSLKLHGGCVHALGYQDCDGETCMAGAGLKSFFKKVANKAKDLGKKALKTVGNAVKSVGQVATNIVGNAAQDFVNSGAAENLMNAVVNTGVNKVTGKVKNLATNLLKGKGYEAGYLNYDFEKYFDDNDIYITMKGLKGSGRNKGKNRNKGKKTNPPPQNNKKVNQKTVQKAVQVEEEEEEEGDDDDDDDGKEEMVDEDEAEAEEELTPEFLGNPDKEPIDLNEDEDFPEPGKLLPDVAYRKHNTTVITNTKGQVVQIIGGTELNGFTKTGKQATLLYPSIRQQQEKDTVRKMKKGIFSDPDGSEQAKYTKKVQQGIEAGRKIKETKKKKQKAASSSSSEEQEEEEEEESVWEPIIPYSAEQMAELGYFGGLWQRIKEIGLMIRNKQNFLNGFFNLVKSATFHQTPVDYSTFKACVLTASLVGVIIEGFVIIGPICHNSGRGDVLALNKEAFINSLTNETEYVYNDASGVPFHVTPAERLGFAQEIKALTEDAYTGKIKDGSAQMQRLYTLYNKFPAYQESTLAHPFMYGLRRAPTKVPIIGPWFTESISTTVKKLGEYNTTMSILRQQEKKAMELGEREAKVAELEITLNARILIIDKMIDSLEQLQKGYLRTSTQIRNECNKKLEEQGFGHLTTDEMKKRDPKFANEYDLLMRFYDDAYTRKKAYEQLSSTLYQVREERDQYYNSTHDLKERLSRAEEKRSIAVKRISDIKQIEKDYAELNANYIELEGLYNATRDKRDEFEGLYNRTLIERDQLAHRIPESHEQFIVNQTRYLQQNNTLDPSVHDILDREYKPGEKLEKAIQDENIDEVEDFYKTMDDQILTRDNVGEYAGYVISQPVRWVYNTLGSLLSRNTTKK